MVLGHIRIAVVINLVLIRVSWWYFVIMTFFLRKEQSPSRHLLQVFFITITLIFTAFWLTSSPTPSEIKNNLFGRQILIANGLLIGGLFAMILNARIRRLLLDAQQSATTLALTQKTLELERALKEQAEEQARTDYLTGLFNRRQFVELAERERVRASRYRRPFALMMIDIDHFKAVNDAWGHGVGDWVLQEVSRTIRDTLRNVDIFGRVGGEEFAVVIVETDEINAKEVAQRICTAVAGAHLVLKDGRFVQVTISIGLTEMKNRDLNLDSLLVEADQALYRAKQLGRNRVITSEYCSAS
jgi:diguanylate cyclase (GGDEF)-like protein